MALVDSITSELLRSKVVICNKARVQDFRNTEVRSLPASTCFIHPLNSSVVFSVNFISHLARLNVLKLSHYCQE